MDKITWSSIYQQFMEIKKNLDENLYFTLSIIAILLIVYFINLLFKRKLNILGIIPRRLFGLPGIICSPFLHADFNHLLFNSIPLFVLTNFTLILIHANYLLFYKISAAIILISGFLTWCFGRFAIHIGASGAILGYFGLLLSQAYMHPSFMIIIIAFMCFYYFFGLVLSLIPTNDKTSWEGHIFGLIAGIITWSIFLN